MDAQSVIPKFPKTFWSFSHSISIHYVFTILSLKMTSSTVYLFTYPLLGTLVVVLQCFLCITKWCGTLVFYVTEWSPVLLCLLVVCCYVCLGLGLNCMQELRVEETSNWLDKPSEEMNLTKI